jgi:hypothetical protein
LWSGQEEVRRRIAFAGRISFYSLLLTACIALSFAVYGPFLRDHFVLDDFIWLHAARTPDAAQFARDAFGFPAATSFSVPTPFWRPLIDGYFFVAWRLFGLNPLPYHMTNVAVHAANAVLLALLVRRIAGSRLVALVTALIWLVLPAYDYTVVWISEATELLATFWYLSTLVLFTVYLQAKSNRSPLYVAALISMALALLAKQSSATIPVVLAMLTAVTVPQRSWAGVRRLSFALWPFFALVIAYALFLYPMEYRSSAEAGIYRIGPHALANAWDYLLRLAWPFTTPGVHVESLASRLAALLFLTTGIGALLLRRPLLSLAFVWTIVALAPYSFFPMGTESRYLYLPAMPFVLFVVLLTWRALGLIRRPAWRGGLGLAALLAVVPLSVMLAQESRERQQWIQEQSVAYHQLFVEVPMLCGALPDGSRLGVVGGPMLDLYGESTRMALQLRYPRAHVQRLDGGAPSPDPAGCTVWYLDGRFERVGAGTVDRVTPAR